MKYTKINSLTQYTEYCNIHESLFTEDEDKHSDEIYILELLIEDYDNRIKQDKYGKLNPVELFKTVLKNNNITQIAIAKELGVSKSLISEILSYKKGISQEMARRLSKHFAMSLEAFSRKYKLISSPAKKQYVRKQSSSTNR